MWRLLRKSCLLISGVSNRRGIASHHLKVSTEVTDALKHGEPVVALESTIITHGMPYPDNIQTAEKVESVVRSTGSVPATVGIIDGRVLVGMDRRELEYLAKSDDVVKTSRRDMAMVLSQGRCGGTTVSGTMVAAHAAGIPIFVTGGIGGVHRCAESSMDISADLTELSRTPVTVVCAGVKSILDIGRTLEYLETQGVPVIKFGADRSMPAFFTPSSPFFTSYNVQSPTEAAACIATSHDFKLDSGMVIAVPIPAALSASGAAIEDAIQTALKEAEQNNILGKDVTPYILQRVNELTEGQSLQANIGLILNNALIGGQIAKALSDLRRRQPSQPSEPTYVVTNYDMGKEPSETERQSYEKTKRRPVVIGGSIVDFIVKFGTEKYDLNGGTYPGGVRQLYGGVGRNMADCLSRLQMAPLFISAVGRDGQGRALIDYCQDHMDVSGISRLEGASTATYVATIEKSGQIMFGVGDMDIHGTVTPEMVGAFESDLREASFVCLDGNIPPSTIKYVTQLCNAEGIPVLYEPTDIHKASKVWSGGEVTYTSPNLGELLAMYDSMTGAKTMDDLRVLSKSPMDQVLSYVSDLCATLVERIPNLLVTLGAGGLLVYRRAKNHQQPFLTRGQVNDTDNVVAVHYRSQLDHPVVSVSGAGDCLVSAMVTSILQGHAPDLACKSGLKCAHHSLSSYHTVPPEVRPALHMPSAVLEWAELARTEGLDVTNTGGRNFKLKS